eukprot:943149-Rhodomonas_salina.2
MGAPVVRGVQRLLGVSAASAGWGEKASDHSHEYGVAPSHVHFCGSCFAPLSFVPSTRSTVLIRQFFTKTTEFNFHGDPVRVGQLTGFSSSTFYLSAWSFGFPPLAPQHKLVPLATAPNQMRHICKSIPTSLELRSVYSG